MEKRFSDIPTLLQVSLVPDEWADTAPLITQLAHVWDQQCFTREEFLRMCKWKDPRELRRRDLQANSDDDLRRYSEKAFTAADEARRALYLCQLKGVGLPVASAILTLTNPQDYGVIDIRVWQLLCLYGEFDYDTGGTNLQLLHWLEYLDKLREWAQLLNLSARTVERTLFQHRRDIQVGTLYGN